MGLRRLICGPLLRIMYHRCCYEICYSAMMTGDPDCDGVEIIGMGVWARSQCGPRRRAGSEMTTLYVRKGNVFREARARDVLLQAKQLVDEQFQSRFLVFGNSDQVRLFLKIQLGGRDHEVFAILFLDSRRRLIEYCELFRGTIDIAAVYPREVVKEALARNAAGVILVHNHPSGLAEPTVADEQITRRLKAALDLVGVKLIDHMIVGESITSFVELGLI